MEGKKSFLLYCDMIHIFEELTDEQAGRLTKIIFDYVNDKNPEIKDQVLKVSFAPIKAQLKRDLQEWLAICDRNRRNGANGGRPSKNQKDLEKPKKPSGLDSTPVKPDNDTDTDKDISKNQLEIHNEIFRKLWVSNIWLETLCTKWKKDKEEVQKHLNDFRLECIAKDDLKDNEKDAKSHFINWVKFNPFPEVEKPKYPKSTLKDNWW